MRETETQRRHKEEGHVEMKTGSSEDQGLLQRFFPQAFRGNMTLLI
jgi:hypothetical protein